MLAGPHDLNSKVKTVQLQRFNTFDDFGTDRYTPGRSQEFDVEGSVRFCSRRAKAMLYGTEHNRSFNCLPI